MENKTTEITVAHTNRTEKKVTVSYYVTSVPGIIITKSEGVCKKNPYAITHKPSGLSLCRENLGTVKKARDLVDKHLFPCSYDLTQSAETIAKYDNFREVVIALFNDSFNKTINILS